MNTRSSALTLLLVATPLGLRGAAPAEEPRVTSLANPGVRYTVPGKG